MVFVYIINRRGAIFDPQKSAHNYIKSYNKVPWGFTESYDKNTGKFNVYFQETNDSGDLVYTKSQSDVPINADGTEYRPINHGDITETDTGFRIDGISAIFDCDDSHYWDSDKKLCIAKPICKTDDNNTIRGIGYYQFKKNLKGTEDTFHDRVYAVCTGSIVDSTKYCIDNTLFDSSKHGMNYDDSNPPCMVYDICDENLNGFKHRSTIPNDDVPLGENEYYICENAVSVRKSCPDNLVYSDLYRACKIKTNCIGHEDGYTFPIAGDDDSYITCLGENDKKITCKSGVYRGDGDDKLACVDDNCISKITSERSTNFADTPFVAVYCEKNKLVQMICDENDIEISYPLPDRPSASIMDFEPRSNLYLENVKINDKIISVENTTSMPVISNTQDQPDMTIYWNGAVGKIAFTEGTMPSNYNVFINKPAYNGYFNYLDTILDKDNNVILENASTNNIIPFIYSTSLMQYDPVNFENIVIEPSSKALLQLIYVHQEPAEAGTSNFRRPNFMYVGYIYNNIKYPKKEDLKSRLLIFYSFKNKKFTIYASKNENYLSFLTGVETPVATGSTWTVVLNVTESGDGREITGGCKNIFEYFTNKTDDVVELVSRYTTLTYYMDNISGVRKHNYIDQSNEKYFEAEDVLYIPEKFTSDKFAIIKEIPDVLSDEFSVEIISDKINPAMADVVDTAEYFDSLEYNTIQDFADFKIESFTNPTVVEYFPS
jgi:hypothetical protein